MLRGLLSFSSMTLVSRVLGLVRDITIGTTFGANAGTDAFWVAFRIPNFMRRLFAEGSFSTAFVPVFTEIKETRPHADLKALMARVSGTLGGVLLVVTALGMVFTPQIAMLFNLGEAAPERFGLTVDLLRLTFPFILFVSLTALAGGALNSFHRFGIPAFTPVILNLCMIAGALWLAPRLAVPITALGWAVLAAGVLQLLFQLPSLRRLDLLTLPKWGWRHPDVRKVMRLMVPTLFGSSVAQINLLLDTVIAALLFVGSQTWLSQADRFLELPLGVFGIALGTVILPTLSRHHVNTDHAGFSRALDWGLRTTLMIAVPAMLGLMLLSVPLVATLFQHRAFTAIDTHMTAMSVFGLSFGLPSFALVKVLLPAFYARQDTRTPMSAAIKTVFINVALTALLLTPLWLGAVPGAHAGIALATGLAGLANAWLLWRSLRKDSDFTLSAGWGRHVLRILAACVALAVAVLAANHVIGDWRAWSGAMRWLLMLGVVVAGAGAFGLALLVAGWRPRELRGP